MSAAVRWVPIAVCASVLVLHSLRFDFVTDDAYISFVYARNLAEHGELTFNLGDRVEGYTNFLWTVILAAGIKLGVAPELLARVLGTAFAVATVAVTVRLTETLIAPANMLDPKRRIPRWSFLPGILLGCASGFACWSSGGLETQLFTFLVTYAIERYVAADVSPRLLTRVGVVLALAAMTRPEGLLVAGLVGAHRLVLNIARDRRILPSVDELLCLAAFLVVWGPWFAWRWWYYGWPFPNTYYVKAAGETTPEFDRALRAAGWRYVGQWAEQLKVVWAAPLLLAGLLAGRPRTPRFVWVTLAVPLGLVYLAYAISVGGDFMGLHRFIMPVFVIVAVLAALGLERLVGWIPAGTPRVVAAPAIAIAVVLAFAVTQDRLTERSLHPRPGQFAPDRIDTPAYLDAYARNRAAIGRAMAPCFRDGDFSIVGGAGAQPWYGRMRAIDVFGLVSDRVAHRVPPRNPRPGHTKTGPDPLLATYDPSFVFHCYGIHSAPTLPPLRCGGYWRGRGFEQVTLQVPGLDGRIEDRDDTPGAGPVADRYTFLVREDRELACPGLVR